MTCQEGKPAVLSACPESWVVIILVGFFFGYALFYWFVIRANADRIVRWFLKKLKVKKPEKMTLYAKQFLPTLWLFSFIAMAWFVITVMGLRGSTLVEGSYGFGALGIVFLIAIQKILFPSGGIYGPEVLIMDMFDEGNHITAEDPKGFHGPYEGWIRSVDLHVTKLVTSQMTSMTIPNKVLVNMIITNHDRLPFHFVKIPVRGEIDETAIRGGKETSKYLATLTQADQQWYDRIFKTASSDGIVNESVPVRVIHDEKGASLWLPVRNHRAAVNLKHELISKNMIEVRV